MVVGEVSVEEDSWVTVVVSTTICKAHPLDRVLLGLR
jgi:hypothetical protein